MEKQPPAPRSIANQFTRHYLIASIIPIIILLGLIVLGTVITRNYLTDLITQSTRDLNKDAERSLQQLGEKIIMDKARDVARQIEMYFRMHPGKTFAEMRRDPLFMELAIQKVGQTGYTAITEAHTWMFRVHPNARLNDTDMRPLAEKMPSWWKIVEVAIAGVEASGYYDWREPNGSIRQKYLAVTPVRIKQNGATAMVSATTYIDEFSVPAVQMRQKADRIVGTYQHYISRQLLMLTAVAGIILLLTFLGTYVWGRRAGLRYIAPITRLAESAKQLGDGYWDVQLPDDVLAREDEIGVMARSFSHMSGQLKDTFSRLEQHVFELKQAQEALKISEEHYRSLFDGIPVGLYRTAPDGTFLDANPMMVQMTGHPSLETLKLSNAGDLYADPEERTAWQNQLLRNGGVHVHEIRTKKYNGAEIWLEDHSRAVLDEAGNVLYYEGSVKDVTERILADRALKKSEENFRALYEESRRAQEMYRSLISSSADAIAIYDMDRHVTYVSPMFTTIFGWHSEELIGKSIPFVPESEKASTAAAFTRLIETGAPSPGFESRRLTRDGRIIDVSISASRYNDHQDKPAGILVMYHDISETKRMKEHLQQVERLEAIATLAGGIAHDFNNLLTVIQGTVSLLLYSTRMSDEKYKHFVSIEKQVQRGSRLTRQLLGYARRGKYDVKTLLLNSIIRENADTIKQTRKDIRIHFHLADDLHAIEADVYQMEQVVMNLFINAADAMGIGGDLTLTTQNIKAADIPDKLRDDRTGDYVLFTIEDTGIGMDKKTMDRIFEPFFTTKPVNKGTGLGLASVYGIIKSHGGAIDVAAQSGVGSKFFIYLPASDKKISLTIVPSKKTLHGKGTVLIIDDEKPVLEVASEMLKSIGYETMKADNGREGLEIYRQNKDRIDLVIIDMIMPDMNGGHVFDRLRDENARVTVLLASGYSIDGRATEILNRGCNGFIQKPFGLEELSEKISSILKA
ncbi:MAG: PAS domain S-box protein [Deltaproteobacteria bacterium]